MNNIKDILSKCIIENDKYICNICGKEYGKYGIATHIWRKHTEDGIKFKCDPNIGYKNGTRKAWNKGLTKESDKRLKTACETYNKNYKLGLHKKSIAKNKEKWKKKISEGIIKAIKNNPSSYNGNYNRGNVKVYKYKNIKLIGKWELKFAIWCDKNSIIYNYNNKGFDYIYNNKKHVYFPDFYLINEDKYIEIKGYKTDRDKEKWNQFPKNIKLEVLTYNELNKLGVLNIISDDECKQFELP